MGTPMAERLLKDGYSLTVFDVNAAVAQALAQKGAQVVASVQAVGDAVDTVLISLPTPDIVKEVTTGEKGLIHGTKVKTVVDLSTTGSGMAQWVHAALAAKGIEFVDSPVGPTGHLRTLDTCAQKHWQNVFHRGQTRHGTNHEAGQQPLICCGHGHHLRSRWHGGQSRT